MLPEEDYKHKVKNDKSGRILGIILVFIGFLIATIIPNMENDILQFILSFFVVPGLLIGGFIYIMD